MDSKNSSDSSTSPTKKGSFQGGGPEVPGYTADGFILWQELQLLPHCLSASVPAMVGGCKLPGYEGWTARYSGCRLERFPSLLPQGSYAFQCSICRDHPRGGPGRGQLRCATAPGSVGGPPSSAAITT